MKLGTQERIAAVIGALSVPLAVWYAAQAQSFLAQRRHYSPTSSFEPSYSDFIPAVVFAVCIVIAKTSVSKLFLSKLAQRVVQQQPEWDESELEQRREKFQHCFFLVLYYVIATGMGWYVLYDKPWVPAAIVPGASGAVHECWTNFWDQTTGDDIGVRLYYMLSLGYALQSLVMLIIRKHRRDFLEMAAHHALEVLLITHSWVYGYARIGTLVLALHDVGDVSVNATRCANDARATVTSLTLLLVTVVSWIWFRLWAFPYYVIRSTMFEAFDFVAAQNGAGETMQGTGYLFFNVMLCGLYALHWFWFYMFLKIGYHVVFHHKCDDEVDLVVSEKKNVIDKEESEPIIQHNKEE